MKKRASAILLTIVLLAGLGLLLYPSIANLWNRRTQTEAIASYEQKIVQSSKEDIEAYFKEAEDYNKELSKLTYPLISGDRIPGYENLLDIAGSGVMGYITISKIKVEMPIYHGTAPDVLNSAAGHLQGSSLPIGGAGTHCVISAHRGLPSARLFTDLDKLEVGDKFIINVLDRVMTYKVDQVLIVLPDEIDALEIVEGKDYCTLMTCTPYGINTHRILVRGIRVANDDADSPIYISSDMYRVDPLIVAPIVAAPILIIMFAIVLLKNNGKKRRKTNKKQL